MAGDAFTRLNTALLCCVVLLAAAAVIGVYTRPGRSVAPPPAERPLGRRLVIPMGYFYGTYVMHLWLRNYERPFRMRVDSGSSVLLFGDLPGCLDGSQTVCRPLPDRKVETVKFGDVQLPIRMTQFRPNVLTLGYIDGVPRIEPLALRVRVADDSRDYNLPVGFGGGADGLMAQLTVRRLQLWLVDQTWSLVMPCQIVLSPTDSSGAHTVLLRAPLVPPHELAAAIPGLAVADAPTYVFRITAPALPAAPEIQFAVVDIGSTLSYVPLATGDRVTADTIIPVVGTDRTIKLAQQETQPLTGKANLAPFGNRVIVIGNRALNNLVVDIDLDDGPTGMIRLLRPG
jgi:hypothetical protein